MSGGGRWTGSKLGGGSSIIFGRGGLGFRISGVGVGLDQVGLFWLCFGLKLLRVRLVLYLNTRTKNEILPNTRD